MKQVRTIIALLATLWLSSCASLKEKRALEADEHNLRLGRGYYDIGVYDQAEEAVSRVREDSPLSVDARKLSEEIKTARIKYPNPPHMRSRNLRAVDHEGW